MVEYIKIRFGNELDRTGSRFEQTFEDMFRSMGPSFSLGQRLWRPQVDVYETADEIVVLAAIAGVEKDDLDIEVDGKALRISGSRKNRLGAESCRYRLAEIQYGNFERVVMFPVYVDPDKVDASVEDGFLTVRLTKKKLDERKTRIPVSGG